jgi:RimJ/RimL family protein N-acetyltransferase
MRDLRIETERLVIRELAANDWVALHEVESHPSVNRYQAYDPHTEQRSRELITRAQHEATCEPRVLYDLAVTRRGDDRLLGRGGFRRSGHELRIGELWCVLAPVEHGQGIVTEAARAVIDLAFDRLGMHRLFGDCDPRNMASARLMERLGMRREAHHVQNLWAKGEWCDSWVYAVLASDWARDTARIETPLDPSTAST